MHHITGQQGTALPPGVTTESSHPKKNHQFVLSNPDSSAVLQPVSFGDDGLAGDSRNHADYGAERGGFGTAHSAIASS
jgi:hypothetical protein